MAFTVSLQGQKRATNSSEQAPPTPSAVVAEFCRLDFEGYQTSGAGWDKMGQRLTTWPESPGWDSVSVIRSYRIASEQISERKATVNVEYDFVGNLDFEPHLQVNRSRKTVPFTLVFTNEKLTTEQVNGKWQEKKLTTPWMWRIDSPHNGPFVSCDWALHDLDQQIKNTDPPKADYRRALREVREELQNACATPGGK